MTDASVLVRALERCREFAESERKNTQMLMSNPPQSSAAWNIRNFINDEIKALAKATLSNPEQEGKETEG